MSRSPLLLWLGGAALLLASLAAFLETPFRVCPDCDGGGIEFVGQPGSDRSPCERCLGRGTISLRRKWTTKPKMTYVGAFKMGDYARFAQPALAREGISLIPGDASLGIIGYYAESPAQAMRARKVIEQDARTKGYLFR